MKRVIRRPVAGLAIIGAAALIAGCGGGDDDTTTTVAEAPPALSAEEFRDQANAVCADISARTDEIDFPETPEGIADALDQVRDAQDEGVDRLRDITPPEEFEAEWEEAIGLQEELVAAVGDAVDRIEAGDDPETVFIELSGATEEQSERLDEIAADLGLDECLDEDGGTTTDESTTGDTLTDEGTTDGTDTDGGTAGATVTPDVYLADVQETAGALQSFGQLLQTVDSADDLGTIAPQAQAHLDDFDAGIAEMAGYTVDNPTVERQRAGLVETGPEVSDVLRRFVDAAAEGDASAVQSLLPEVLSALQSFSAAATVR